MEIRNKLTSLDSIEMLKVVDRKEDFPEHYHDTYCISLIENGIESIKMGDNIMFTEKGNISINNPFEIHANPAAIDSQPNSFTTIYLSPELVHHFFKKKSVLFHHQQFTTYDKTHLFYKLCKTIKENNALGVEKIIKQFLQSLQTFNRQEFEEVKFLTEKWSELILLINHNLEDKITLDLLARFMNMDKYNFAKMFRLRFGLSPINYVLMKKIFASKKDVIECTNLSMVAYKYNFSDQAHFSKLFKRFVGVSPSEYKNQNQ